MKKLTIKVFLILIMVSGALFAYSENSQEEAKSFVSRLKSLYSKGKAAKKAADLLASFEVVASENKEFKKELFKLLNSKNEPTRLIEEKYRGPRETKSKYSFMSCIFVISAAQLHQDFAEREKYYNKCAEIAKIDLEPRDIEEVFNQYPHQTMQEVITGQGRFEGIDKELAKLCLKNPLGPKVFTAEENSYYCTLSLGFRACNLVVQQLDNIGRNEAFEKCKDRGVFALTSGEQTQYQAKMAKYLSAN